MTVSRIITYALLAAFAASVTAQPALSQTATAAPLPGSSKTLHLGNLCQSKKLTGDIGVIKVDLCNRPYCGSTITDEPFIKRDYDRKRIPCEFQLVDGRCRCVGKVKR